MENKSDIIVTFHIGRGGRFHNANHRTFIGEKNIQDIVNLRCNQIFHRDRDEKGRFMTPSYYDHNGNFLITEKEVATGVGSLDFDGIYDTYYSKYIDDCDENEISIILESGEWLSTNSQDFILENYPDLMEDKKFEPYSGRVIEVDYMYRLINHDKKVYEKFSLEEHNKQFGTNYDTIEEAIEEDPEYLFNKNEF